MWKSFDSMHVRGIRCVKSCERRSHCCVGSWPTAIFRACEWCWSVTPETDHHPIFLQPKIIFSDIFRREDRAWNRSCIYFSPSLATASLPPPMEVSTICSRTMLTSSWMLAWRWLFVFVFDYCTITFALFSAGDSNSNADKHKWCIEPLLHCDSFTCGLEIVLVSPVFVLHKEGIEMCVVVDLHWIPGKRDVWNFLARLYLPEMQTCNIVQFVWNALLMYVCVSNIKMWISTKFKI